MAWKREFLKTSQMFLIQSLGSKPQTWLAEVSTTQTGNNYQTSHTQANVRIWTNVEKGQRTCCEGLLFTHWQEDEWCPVLRVTYSLASLFTLSFCILNSHSPLIRLRLFINNKEKLRDRNKETTEMRETEWEKMSSLNYY